MEIEKIDCEVIKDSRGEETIKILMATELGVFAASSPSGKSKGKKERDPYKKNIREDIGEIERLSEEICNINIEKFGDLQKIEKIVSDEKKENSWKIGANTLFALEAAILKALAGEKNKEVWQVINSKANSFPSPVGNCIGGGLHGKNVRGAKPNFQEFLFIPKTDSFEKSVDILREAHEMCGIELKNKNSRGKKNDENAWRTSLSDEEVFDIMVKVRDKIKEGRNIELQIGTDVAASTFFTGLYEYKNPEKRMEKGEQIRFISDLVKKYNVYYIEDPLDEEDFKGFSEIMEKGEGDRLYVGDDLTVSQLHRVKMAIEEKSINAIIVKPNQVGSLIEMAKVISLANKNDIKTVLSHRSGETRDFILADLAFGFQSDYIKTGVRGNEREAKLNRLINIEKKVNE